MHKSTWKNFERQVAKDFGTNRTPLSGMAESLTKADTLHDLIFIECKTRLKMPIFRKYLKEKQSLLVGEDIIVFNPAKYQAKKFIRKPSKFVRTLYSDTKEKADREKKICLLALKEKGRRGYLLASKRKDITKIMELWNGENREQ